MMGWFREFANATISNKIRPKTLTHISRCYYFLKTTETITIFSNKLAKNCEPNPNLALMWLLQLSRIFDSFLRIPTFTFYLKNFARS